MTVFLSFGCASLSTAIVDNELVPRRYYARIPTVDEELTRLCEYLVNVNTYGNGVSPLNHPVVIKIVKKVKAGTRTITRIEREELRKVMEERYDLKKYEDYMKTVEKVLRKANT